MQCLVGRNDRLKISAVAMAPIAIVYSFFKHVTSFRTLSFAVLRKQKIFEFKEKYYKDKLRMVVVNE